MKTIYEFLSDLTRKRGLEAFTRGDRVRFGECSFADLICRYNIERDNSAPKMEVEYSSAGRV